MFQEDEKLFSFGEASANNRSHRSCRKLGWKAISLCLSSCLKAGLTGLAILLMKAFLNCSWKIYALWVFFMAVDSRSLLSEQFQFFSVHFAWLNIKNSLKISSTAVQAHCFLPRPPQI